MINQTFSVCMIHNFTGWMPSSGLSVANVVLLCDTNAMLMIQILHSLLFADSGRVHTYLFSPDF